MNYRTNGKTPTLKELILWVTTDCNLRCRYCYAFAGSDIQYMEWETARKAIDIMNVFSDRYTIQFAGGEPLLNPGLIERIIGYCSGRDVKFQLQTNGTLISTESAGKLKQLGIDIGVSLDGIPEVNDKLRVYPDGKGTGIHCIRGIKILGEAGIHVGCTCVISSENENRIPELVDLLSYLGNVEGISLDFLRLSGRAVNNNIRPANPEITTRSVNSALERAGKLAEMGGKFICFREAERMRYLIHNRQDREHRCYFDANQLLMVKPDGDAYPCASLAEFPEFRLGNIFDSGFENNLRGSLSEKHNLIPTPEACRSCPDFQLCGGPCPAQVYANNPTGFPGVTGECPTRQALMSYSKYKNRVIAAAVQ